jgi:hypothetical protein
MTPRVLDPTKTATPLHPDKDYGSRFIDPAFEYILDAEDEKHSADFLAAAANLNLDITCDLKRLSSFSRGHRRILLDLQPAFDAQEFLGSYALSNEWPRAFAVTLFWILRGVAISNSLIHLDTRIRAFLGKEFDNAVEQLDHLRLEPTFYGLFGRPGFFGRPLSYDREDVMYGTVSFLIFHEIAHFLQRPLKLSRHDTSKHEERERAADNFAVNTLLELDKYFEPDAFFEYADVLLFGALTSSFIGEHLPSFSDPKLRKTIYDKLINRVNASAYNITLSYATRTGLHRALIAKYRQSYRDPGEQAIKAYKQHSERFVQIYRDIFVLLDTFLDKQLSEDSLVLEPDVFDLEPALHFLYSAYEPSDRVHHISFDAWEIQGGGLIYEERACWIMAFIRKAYEESWSRERLAKSIRREGRRLNKGELRSYGYRPNLGLGTRFLDALTPAGRINPVRSCDEILYLNFDVVFTKMAWRNARLGTEEFYFLTGPNDAPNEMCPAARSIENLPIRRDELPELPLPHCASRCRCFYLPKN